MTCYLVQLKDRVFVKGYGFLSFAKNIGKNISKNISKNLSGKYNQKLLDHDKQYATNTQKEQFKKQQKQLVIWLVTKWLIELRKYQNIHNEIIPRQLKKGMTKKYLKKDIYLQQKNR